MNPAARKIRVLVVDDSVLARRLVTESLAADPVLEVVGSASDGVSALAQIKSLRPDAVTLDVAMPGMDGIETVASLRASYPRLPVIMVSAFTESGAMITIEALARGATDYVTKPATKGNWPASVTHLREQLVPKLKAVFRENAAVPRLAAPPAVASPGELPAPSDVVTPARVVAIAASTGGPSALERLVSDLPPNLAAPLVVVQHMPPIFTRFLAERLTRQCSLPAREAVDGDVLQPGTILIAPGDMHMEVNCETPRARVRLHQGPPVNSCRPSADVLFRSVADSFDRHAMALVLTGMGSDGLDGCRRIRELGGRVVVQDESSSVVWGMPGSAAQAGLANRVLPLDQLGAEICRRVRG